MDDDHRVDESLMSIECRVRMSLDIPDKAAPIHESAKPSLSGAPHIQVV